MSPNGGGEPSGNLLKAINESFGSFAEFKNLFNKAAATRFGSGWAWLVNLGGNLIITSTPTQELDVTGDVNISDSLFMNDAIQFDTASVPFILVENSIQMLSLSIKKYVKKFSKLKQRNLICKVSE